VATPLITPPFHRDYRGRPETWIEPVIDPTARFEFGCNVQYGIKRATRVGARTWVLSRVSIGHDCLVGDDCEIADASMIGAHSELGDGVRIGISTVVRPGIRIGAGARTGCGAVVVKDIPAGETWVGVPARRLEREPAGVGSHNRDSVNSLACAELGRGRWRW
jgi:acetyltransferase-like isoleucine patch superfamily enzyme